MVFDVSIKFDKPAYYRIIVSGEIDDQLIAFLELINKRVIRKGVSKITKLEIHVKDQAMLSGVLNTLYDNRHCIISVQSSEIGMVNITI